MNNDRKGLQRLQRIVGLKEIAKSNAAKQVAAMQAQVDELAQQHQAMLDMLAEYGDLPATSPIVSSLNLGIRSRFCQQLGEVANQTRNLLVTRRRQLEDLRQVLLQRHRESQLLADLAVKRERVLTRQAIKSAEKRQLYRTPTKLIEDTPFHGERFDGDKQQHG